jgi:hypothetical protein
MGDGAYSDLIGGRFLALLFQNDPIQAAFMQRIIGAINKLGDMLGAKGVGLVEPPPPVNAVNVAVSGEMMHVSLQQTAPINRGINYFVEVDTSPNFPAPQVVAMGPSRSSVPFSLPTNNSSGTKVNYYVRAFAQYPGSLPSKPTVFGGPLNPSPINMGGSTDLTLLPAGGSGTSSATGQQGNSGFGRVLNSTGIAPATSTSVAPVVSQSSTVTAASTVVTGDGLDHGTTPWETDPSTFLMLEDFITINAYEALQTVSIIGPYGQYGWMFFSNAPSEGSLLTIRLDNAGGFSGGFGGSISWENNGIQGEASTLTLPATYINSSPPFTYGYHPGAIPLLENPGWKATWVWKVDGSQGQNNGFSTAKKAFYVGMAGPTLPTTAYNSTLGNFYQARPPIFLGLRYDTSIGPGAIAISSITANSPSAGYTLLTFTSTQTAAENGGWVGLSFSFSGGLSGGPYNVVGSNQSYMIVLGSVAGTSGTATSSTTGDSFYTFEYVQNPAYGSLYSRNNTQGTKVVTTVSPVAGTWHRLDMTCTAAGIVTMTLDGSSTATFTIPLITCILQYTGSSVSANSSVANNVAYVEGIGSNDSGGGISHAEPLCQIPPIGAGSQITISGMTGTLSPLNGTWITTSVWGSVSGVTFITPNTTSITQTSTPAGAQLTCYPALLPFMSGGNDDEASPTTETMRFYWDFFGLAWNPGLGATPKLAPNPAKARYF